MPSDVLGLIIARRNGGMIKLFAVAGGATILVTAVVVLLPMSPLSPLGPAFWVLLALGGLVAALTFAFPWASWEPDRARAALTGLMIAGIALVGGLVWRSGGAGSDQVWSILLITIFAAAIHTPRWQAILYSCTAAAYVTGSALAGSVPVGTVTHRLAIIGVVALTTGYLAGMMRRALADVEIARLEAQRQAERFALVARGVRSAAVADPVAVVTAVAETVAALGWDWVAIFVSEDGALDLAAWESGDGSEGPDGPALRLSSAWAAEILQARRPVTLSDTKTHPVLAGAAQDLGVVSAVGAPFVADGRPAGVVVAGSRSRQLFTEADVEAFELVGSSAGRALELAHRYRDEHERVAELRDLDRLRSEFLSTVSHELRTPLTVILGLSETVDRLWDRLDDGGRRELLDRIRDNAGSLDRVIATLLDFSRLEQGRLETRFDTFDVTTLIETVLVRLGPMLQHHQVVFDPPGPLPVHGDDRLLERVFENLLSNAQRHTPPGTTVTLTCVPAARTIQVRVADDGPGIAAEDVAHLGERFYRAGDPTERPSRGVGLGLALSQEVLRLHGSRLHVTSTVGQGTAFAFTLPTPVPATGISARPGTTTPAG